MDACASADRLTSDWIASGVMDAARVRELESHLASCVRCARRIRPLVAFMLRDADGTPVSAAAGAPPEGLASGILARVADGRRSRDARPRFRVPALAAAAMLLVVLAGTVAYRAGVLRGWSANGDRIIVRFELAAPEARSVSLVGDFTGWEEQELGLRDKDGDGLWELTVRLEKGRAYSYNFLVDGEQWVVDPHASVNVEDGFGGMSSVIVL